MWTGCTQADAKASELGLRPVIRGDDVEQQAASRTVHTESISRTTGRRRRYAGGNLTSVPEFARLGGQPRAVRRRVQGRRGRCSGARAAHRSEVVVKAAVSRERPSPGGVKGGERAAGTAGEAFSLYVGIAQIPMYFAPLLLGPLLRRCLLAAFLADLLPETAGGDRLVWAHNLGLGRNLCLTRELTRACHEARIPLIAHHHDWWFENRWQHFRGTRAPGFRSLRAVAHAVFAVGAIAGGVGTALADLLAGFAPTPGTSIPVGRHVASYAQLTLAQSKQAVSDLRSAGTTLFEGGR